MKISFKAYTILKFFTLAIFIMILFSFESEFRYAFIKLLVCYELLQILISSHYFKKDISKDISKVELNDIKTEVK